MKGIKKIWQIFPSQTVAYYSPIGHYIQLNLITESRMRSMRADPENPTFTNDYAILNHEMQHWLDHHSTLWGLKNNIKIYKAFNAKCNMKETNFFHIHEAMREFKRNSLIDYYSETYNKIDGSKKEPWRWSLSSGLRFSYEGKFDEERPILFVKFHSAQDKPVCRTPVSLCSLLETKAIDSEYDIRFSRILKLDSANGMIESKLMEDRLFSELYDSELVLYSVAVHLAANILNISDFVQAIKIASKVATIALNLTEKFFKEIKIPSGLEAFNQRPKKMLEQSDPGFAYYCLLKNYSDTYKASCVFEINELLTESGLPNVTKIKAQMVEESYRMIPKADNGPFINYMIEKIGVFQKLNSECPSFPTLSDLNKLNWIKNVIPTVFCADTNFDLLDDKASWQLVRGPISKLDMQEYHSVTDFLGRKLEEFDAICGV
jgi:hypothetical protein